MKNLLVVEALRKTFTMHHFHGKDIVGCEDIHLSLPQGRFIGLTGESGAGKSTILKCIYRTYTPTEGTVLFDSDQLGPIDLAKATGQGDGDRQARDRLCVAISECDAESDCT